MAPLRLYRRIGFKFYIVLGIYMKIIIAQMNATAGAVHNNMNKILRFVEEAKTLHQADLIIFPELALSGYAADDLLLREDFIQAIESTLEKLVARIHGISVIIGCPLWDEHGVLHNAAVVIQEARIIAKYYKQILPNYGVFDEYRYFKPGGQNTVFQLNEQGPKFGLLICEDTWFLEPAVAAVQAGADILLSIHASPFAINKIAQRRAVYTKLVAATNLPLICVQTIGAQDDLCFDGGSEVYDQAGQCVVAAPHFEEVLWPFEVNHRKTNWQIIPQKIFPDMSLEESVYRALVLGVRDYFAKNNFQQAFIGLSGGIDSALTLLIAMDALGKDRVTAVALPSRYTSDLSMQALEEQLKLTQVKSETISIEPLFEAALASLADIFKGLAVDKTEENMQARCRGLLLMALANKANGLVLTTGNKSEMAVGYATLYGDMAGGFAVLKDVPKTLVFRLANYRNQQSYMIPQVIIDRPPSAELAHGQKDEDSLPPYSILDEIIYRFVDKQESLEKIIAAGFDSAIVKRIARMVMLNEYKRRQAPPGIKITEYSFTRERRYPITHGEWVA